MKNIELCVRPALPYDKWKRALQMTGSSIVGLDMKTEEAVEFRKAVGAQISCFLRGARETEASLPVIECLTLDEALKVKRPPLILRVSASASEEQLDAFLKRYPNRVAVLEISGAEMRSLYEEGRQEMFGNVVRLARVASAKRVPPAISSDAQDTSQLITSMGRSALMNLLMGRDEACGGLLQRRAADRLLRALITQEGGSF
jgi:hypothetical protein